MRFGKKKLLNCAKPTQPDAAIVVAEEVYFPNYCYSRGFYLKHDLSANAAWNVMARSLKDRDSFLHLSNNLRYYPKITSIAYQYECLFC